MFVVANTTYASNLHSPHGVHGFKHFHELILGNRHGTLRARFEVVGLCEEVRGGAR